MPNFEIVIERKVPSYRERTTVVVVADSIEDLEDNFDFALLNDIELDWEEVMEGHGGFACDYKIQKIDQADDKASPDIDLSVTD